MEVNKGPALTQVTKVIKAEVTGLVGKVIAFAKVNKSSRHI